VIDWVDTKRVQGRLLVCFRADDGYLVAIPPDWTDLVGEDPVKVVGEGRSWFRVDDLAQLADLIDTLHGHGPKGPASAGDV